ncbi:hypothetical protein [Leptospira ilyithenensis]|uniref:DUF3619 family protein n=1 Tax=Leptospira ilyithenensis TaxID=2484901 RepID=A0A4R9LLB4_9LEPT|nr:hypothetical protein [Leptospira ilyithenensis]TGN06547.1 hypothetical protein EHS11_19550 [Leptospira ilyithenensis]
MNENLKSNLDQTIDQLIQDPQFSKRVASRVLKAAEQRLVPANNGFPIKWIYAVASAFFFAIGISQFLNFEMEEENYSPLSQDSAIEISAPEKSESLWEETDSIILTTFGSR